MKPFKRIKWLGMALLCLLAAAVVGYFCRVSLLRGAAHAWIVNQPLAPADVIVVLGGGLDTRPFEAARLYHLGLAPKILLMNPRPAPSAELGLVPTEADLSRSILLKKGVPAGAIVVPGTYVLNSFDESLVLRDWARTNRIKRAIIATDIFHTRRVRWLYDKELRHTGLQIEVDAVPVHEYSVDDWWLHEQGIIAFQNELLKYGYYRLKY
jgi:uncharacterized SAM-binding protein YcdF (DUF218 family)